MKPFLTLGLLTLVAAPLSGQRVTVSGGEVSRTFRADASRLAARIPGVDSAYAARVRVSGDSAQRIALHDFDWRGRVSSVEIDEQDTRLFWDVKIVPDTSDRTIIRYRVDAITGGVLGIKQFAGVRGLARRP
jgi:uncharacterized membrane protein YkoI